LWIKGVGLAGAGAVDGIDIDWEFPGAPGETNNYSPADKANFVALMQEFRNQLNTQGAADGKTYTISAAMNTTAGNISAGYDLAALAPVMDFFMLMTYDFHGSWEATGPTNFHSNLYPVTGDPAGNTLNIQAAVGRFTSAGVPANKIVVGVPFYGRGWSNVASTNNGLFQSGSAPFIEITYKDIKANYETNAAYTKFRHAEARTVWLYSSSARVFIGYDDPQTMQDKAQYIVNNGLKGAMFWEQTQDDSTFSLTQALCTNLGLAASGRC
jgi:chitinase